MIKFRIKQIVHRQPWLINGVWFDRGWLVTTPNGFINLCPGAGWFTTVESAWLGIEALIKAGADVDKEADATTFHRVFRELKGVQA